MRTFVVGALAVALLAGSALADDRPLAGPNGYTHDGVGIFTRSIKQDKSGKVWFKLTVTNSTGKFLIIDRNQILARLPDGTERSRETGTWGAMWADQKYLVQPGQSHELNVEYEVPFGAPVSLELKGFTVDGKPIPLPAFEAK